MAEPRSELIIRKVKDALSAMTVAGGYYYTTGKVIRVPFLSDVDFSSDYETEYIMRAGDGTNTATATKSTQESHLELWVTAATRNHAATSNPWMDDGSNPLAETIQRRMIADVKKALFGMGTPQHWSTWGYGISALNLSDEDLEQDKQLDGWAYVHMRIEVIYREQIA